MNNFEKILTKDLKAIWEQKPLIHHITNFVTMQDCANLCVAVGASPFMAFYEEEVEEAVNLSKALVLNLGTPSPERIRAIILAGKKANENKIPIILDPVGVGATSFRKKNIEKILQEIHIDVIKGNVAEIKSLLNVSLGENKGVDSSDLLDKKMKQNIKNLAALQNCIVVVTGETDIITNGKQMCEIKRGSKMITNISGAGCMNATLIGSFCAVNKDYFVSACEALFTMNYVAEQAEKALQSIDGAGMFKIRLFDMISHLHEYEFEKEEGVIFV